MHVLLRMRTKYWAILLMVVCTFLTSTAQVFYKKGAADLTSSVLGLITNYNLLAGVFLYAIGAVVMIVALRGGEVSVLYPIVATSYIWVCLASMVFFGEAMGLFKWLGVAAITLGIFFITKSGSEIPEENPASQSAEVA